MFQERTYIFPLFITLTLIIFVQSDKYRLPDNVKPRKYKIYLNPDITAKNGTFEGSVLIVIDVLSRTKNLTLHSSNLTIDNSQTILRNKTDKFVPINHTLVNVTEFLIIKFNEALQPGKYKLALKFHGYLNDNRFQGFYRSSYSNAENNTTLYAMTHFEPTYARQAFPCWDEPALKANFEINIKHFPNYTALSNMPVFKKMKKPSKDGKIWTQFQQTPLLSTYTLAFTISDFKNITNKSGNYSVWTRRNVPDSNTEFGFKIGLKALEIFENLMGVPYLLPKMDMFLVPKFGASAMENWGLIVFKEEFFLRNTTTPNSFLQKIVNTICHEIIHQWIGNLVSPARWSDLWITESLPTYFQYLIFNKMKLKEISGTVQQSMQTKMWQSFKIEEHGYGALQNISDTSSIFTQFPVIYIKMPVIINMLANVITRTIFHRAVRRMIREYQFKSITTDQFLEIIQQTVNRANIVTDKFGAFDVKAFMLPYITQVGYPVIRVLRNNATGVVELIQECYICRENNSTELKWPIPITYTTQSSLDFRFQRPIHFLNPSEEKLIISNVSPHDWIIINIQSLGYYRVNYDNKTWQQLTDYMNSEKFMNIPVRNRIKLLDDASWLVWKEKLSIDTFYNILFYCERERDTSVWENLMNIIARIMLSADENILNVYSNLVNSVGEKIKLEKGDYKSFIDLAGVRFLHSCRNFKDLCKKVVF